MFKNIKQIFSARNKDIRKKILFTLLILFIYKLGTAVRVPGTENITEDLGFLELLNVMGGGSLKNFSIFALGVTPYISASIIIQLLQMDIIPYFSNLAKEGHTGRVKLNKITRYLGIVLAFLQGLVISFLGASSGAVEYVRVSIILTAGTCFLLWLGDQITSKGVGNGVSMLIMAGILISTPTMMKDAFSSFVVSGTVQEVSLGVTKFILFLLAYILIIVGVVFIEKSERRIPVQYSNKTLTAYGAKQTYIPFKLNSAGVMPVIFASSLISIPSLIATFLKKDSFSLFVNKYINYNTVTGFILYILLIILFTYLYTFMASGLRPKELAENLNKQGGYVPGVRPGNETKKYITKVLSRTTFMGAVFLLVIAGIPILVSNLSSLPTNVTVGGTGLLIVVGVALETYNQIESSLSARKYERSYRK